MSSYYTSKKKNDFKEKNVEFCPSKIIHYYAKNVKIFCSIFTWFRIIYITGKYSRCSSLISEIHKRGTSGISSKASREICRLDELRRTIFEISSSCYLLGKNAWHSRRGEKVDRFKLNIGCVTSIAKYIICISCLRIFIVFYCLRTLHHC